MSEAPRRHFSYPAGLSRGALLGMLVSTAVAIVIAVRMMNTPPPSEREYGALLLCTLLIGWICLLVFFRSLPIALSDEGVAAFIGDRVWRRIAWRDMDRIEKRITPGGQDEYLRYHPSSEFIVFANGRRTIIVRPDIVEYETVKRCATEEAKRHGIEIARVEPQPHLRPSLVTPLDEL